MLASHLSNSMVQRKNPHSAIADSSFSKRSLSSKQNTRLSSSRSSISFDEDTSLFVNMSQELKDEGNRLFQRHDHEGAMKMYEKAIKMLPKNHADLAYLRSNMAACYMQLGFEEYPRAINQCNLALKVSPGYTKALLKRARCYEALNRFDLALRDVNKVLSDEPSNLTALELLGTIKATMAESGISSDEKLIGLAEEDEGGASRLRKVVKEKIKKKKKSEKGRERKVHGEDKLVVVEKSHSLVKEKAFVMPTIEEEKEVTKDVKEEKIVTKTVKLVYKEDIRYGQIPVNCRIGLLRDVIRDRFPGIKGVLIKYRDREGDLVTITKTEELRMAELSSDSQGSIRFYVVEVSLNEEPPYEGKTNVVELAANGKTKSKAGRGEGVTCLEDWIIQFAQQFKNHVGFDTDSYLDMHEIGMKLYSEAMEDTVTSEEAQELFDTATEKFQEMAALALFNWGNVHMSKARKRLFIQDNESRASLLVKVRDAYEWANEEYIKAGARYEEALKIKPNFYEGHFALAQQQFEQAKLCWYYAVGSNIDIEDGPSEEVLDLYNKAEDSLEKGVKMAEELKEKNQDALTHIEKRKAQIKEFGLDSLLKDVSAEEAAEQALNMSSQIYLLWGTMLYERSVVEYKIEIPTWDECLEVAIEKFELAGASPTDIAVMIKNHCSNNPAYDGLSFKIDEIIQAWNEMYDAKRWEVGVPSFRLEPLFRRRVPKLHDMLERV